MDITTARPAQRTDSKRGPLREPVSRVVTTIITLITAIITIIITTANNIRGQLLVITTPSKGPPGPITTSRDPVINSISLSRVEVLIIRGTEEFR